MKNYSVFNFFLFPVIILITFSCKDKDDSFYEYSPPSIYVYQVSGAPEEIYAYCASHDIYLDSVYVTSPLNIKSRLYHHGEYYAIDQRFLIGNTFVYRTGTWKFSFYGRRAVNDSSFDVYIEKDL